MLHVPVHPLQPPHPTYPSLNPTIWHTHRTRWPGIGRRTQVPVASSPLSLPPLALLPPLCGGKRGVMDRTALGYPEPLLPVCLFLSLSLCLCLCLLEQQQLLSRTSPVSSPLRFLRVAAAGASPFTERVQKKKKERKKKRKKTAQPTTKRVFFFFLSSPLLSPLFSLPLERKSP